MAGPNDPGTFCYYCQEDFEKPHRLLAHIEKKHQGTYAYHTYITRARQGNAR